MKCYFCKKTIDDDSHFCKYCGQIVKEYGREENGPKTETFLTSPYNHVIVSDILFHGSASQKREALKLIYAHTKSCIAYGYYCTVTDVDDARLAVPILYKSAFKTDCPKLPFETEITLCNGDSLTVARSLHFEGLKPAVLCFANRHNPLLKIEEGIDNQEADIFRRTNISSYLDYFSREGIDCYPLDKDYGAIYAPDVTVFKDSRYKLTGAPYRLDIISMPAVYQPQLDEKGHLTSKMENVIRNKIRQIFRIGLINGNDSLVLGAYGCGAYKNPPADIARLFVKVMNESEFKNRYKKIIFSLTYENSSFGGSLLDWLQKPVEINDFVYGEGKNVNNLTCNSLNIFRSLIRAILKAGKWKGMVKSYGFRTPGPQYGIGYSLALVNGDEVYVFIDTKSYGVTYLNHSFPPHIPDDIQSHCYEVNCRPNDLDVFNRVSKIMDILYEKFLNDQL